MNKIKLKYKLLNNNTNIPSYAHEDDAGIDLTATNIIKSNWHSVWYNTDIAIEIPKGYFGMLSPRSSISNDGLLQYANSFGVIDSGFRGGMQVRCNRTVKGIFKYIFNKTDCQYNIGDKIGQLIIVPHTSVVLEHYEDLSNSKRNTGGFGSTTKQ